MALHAFAVNLRACAGIMHLARISLDIVAPFGKQRLGEIIDIVPQFFQIGKLFLGQSSDTPPSAEERHNA